MTNEQLTELARQYVKDRYCSETNETPKYKIAQIHAGRDGFIKGAKYMRNSPWHTDEEPFYLREGKQVLILVFRNGELIFSVIKKAEEYEWFYKQNFRSYDLFKYAYIDELLPMEE